MNKIPKVVAGYLPSANVDKHGTSCSTCRDFIRGTSECVILDPPEVSGPSGTCILYVLGRPHDYGHPLRLLPASVAGYTEGPEVPSYCGRCSYYEHPARALSSCSKVGDDGDELVEFGGCCNAYELPTEPPPHLPEKGYGSEG